jgi:hypothetical protein
LSIPSARPSWSTVYRLKGDRFHRAGRFAAAAGDVLTTPLLPGLEIPLAKIFRS